MRSPVKSYWAEGEDPVPPQVERVLMFVITAGTICWLWGAWRLLRWFHNLFWVN